MQKAIIIAIVLLMLPKLADAKRMRYAANIKNSRAVEFVRYGYTGQEKESDLLTVNVELYNYRAREYNPGKGVFLSPDLLKEGYSVYAYVDNNPITYTDPTGMCKFCTNISCKKGEKCGYGQDIVMTKALKAQNELYKEIKYDKYFTLTSGTFGVFDKYSLNPKDYPYTNTSGTLPYGLDKKNPFSAWLCNLRDGKLLNCGLTKKGVSEIGKGTKPNNDEFWHFEKSAPWKYGPYMKLVQCPVSKFHKMNHLILNR